MSLIRINFEYFMHKYSWLIPETKQNINYLQSISSAVGQNPQLRWQPHFESLSFWCLQLAGPPGSKRDLHVSGPELPIPDPESTAVVMHTGQGLALPQNQVACHIAAFFDCGKQTRNSTLRDSQKQG